jgi:hypothetical protein
MEIFQLLAFRSCLSQPPMHNSIQLTQTIAPSILGLPCAAQLTCQTAINWITPLILFITNRCGPCRKHRFSIVACVFVSRERVYRTVAQKILFFIPILHSNCCICCLFLPSSGSARHNMDIFSCFDTCNPEFSTLSVTPCITSNTFPVRHSLMMKTENVSLWNVGLAFRWRGWSPEREISCLYSLYPLRDTKSWIKFIFFYSWQGTRLPRNSKYWLIWFDPIKKIRS